MKRGPAYQRSLSYGALPRVASFNSIYQRNLSTVSVISSDGRNKMLCPFCPPDKHIKDNLAVYHIFAEVMRAVGWFGHYQKFFLILVVYSTILWGGNYLFTAYSLIRPSWNCTRVNNFTTDLVKNSKFCDRWNECYDDLKSYKSFFKSAREEWKMDCVDTQKLTYIHLLKALGGAVGSLVGGHISDHYGRARFLLLSIFGVCLPSVLTTSATSWLSFGIWRGISFFFQAMTEVMIWSLGAEVTSSKHRLMANACHQISVAYIIVSLIAWLTKEWRLYLVIVNFIASPMLIGWMILYESPRWLIQKREFDHAADILTRIGGDIWNRRNAIVVADELRGLNRTITQRHYFIRLPWLASDGIELKRVFKSTSPWFVHLFSTRALARAVAIESISIITSIFVYETMVVNMTDMIMHPFLATAILGACITLTLVLNVLVDRHFSKYGRKTMWAGSLFVIAWCLVAMIIIESLGHQRDSYFLAVPVILGLSMNHGAFRLSTLQITVEYFPTVLRGTATGAVLAMEYCFAALIVKITLSYIGTAVAATVTLALVVVTFVLGLFFQEETKGKFLKDTIEQVR